MSSEVFYWALNMSIHGAVVCLLVLALRRLPFLSPGARYALWLAPMLRLLCPVSVQSRFSLMALLKPHAVRAVQVFPELNSILISFSTMNSVQLAESYDPVAYADRSMEGFSPWRQRCGSVWRVRFCWQQRFSMGGRCGSFAAHSPSGRASMSQKR